MPTRHPVAAIITSLILGVAMQPVFAQSTVEPQHPGNPGYDALLAAAVAPVDAAFGDRVKVEVERLDRVGRWAFLQGTLRGADGGKPDYSGTPYAERAASGGMSDVYVALLRAEAAPAADENDLIDSGTAHDAPAEAVSAAEIPAAKDVAPQATPATNGDPGGQPQDTGGATDTGAPATWTLIDHAIGPSDVAWLTWPTDHAAPRQLFGF